MPIIYEPLEPPVMLSPAVIAKFLVALTAFIGILVSQGVLSGTAEAVANAIIAALSAVGVYAVPNAHPTGGDIGAHEAATDASATIIRTERGAGA